jgi:hypothetical protein
MLKKLILPTLWALLLLFPFMLTAQLSFQMNQIDHDDAMRPSLEIRLKPGADQVKDAWHDFIKDRYDVKLKGIGFLANKDLMTAEEVTFEALSDKKMNFYTRVVEKDGASQMNVFASFGYDIYLSPSQYPEAWHTLKMITHEFLGNFLPGYYEEKIAEVKSSIDDLKNNKKDMQDEMEKNRSEIEKLTERNEELSEKINENEAATEAATTELTQKEDNYSKVKEKLEQLEGSRENG